MAGRLTGLDALRGIAAAMVVIYHTTDRAVDSPFPAYMAVDFFFMLSGYVMARTYEARIGHDLTAVRFLGKRLLRLAPLVALGTVIGFAVALIGRTDHPAPLLGLVLALLLLPTPFTHHLYPFNGPTWSIFFELFANAVHALGLRRVSTPVVLGFGLAMVLLTIAWSAQFGRFSGGTYRLPFLVCFVRVLGPYALGVVLYRWLRDRPLLRPSPLLLYAGLPLALILGGALHPLLFGALFVVAVCPAMILVGIATPSRLGVYLGALSFPLYAVHRPLMKATELASDNALAGVVVAVAGAAAITWLGARQPWTSLPKLRFGRQTAVRAAVGE